MKALYFTIAMLSILAATAVNAQNYEQDYDVINKENLRNQAGFASLRVGNQITGDVMSYDNQNPADTMAMPQQTMAPSTQTMAMPAAPQQPTAPMQPTIAMEPVVPAPQQASIEPTTTQPLQAEQTANADAIMMDPTQLNNMQPAAGNVETTATTNAQPEVIMMENNAPQTVVTKKTIIGNTDTGVNPEAVLQALEGQNMNQ